MKKIIAWTIVLLTIAALVWLLISVPQLAALLGVSFGFIFGILAIVWAFTEVFNG